MLPFTDPEEASSNHPSTNLTRYKTPTNRYQPLVNIKSQDQNIPATNPNPFQDHSPPQSFQNIISHCGEKSRHPKLISPPLLAQVKSSQQNLSDEIPVDSEIVMLLDSNGGHLRTNEIFPKFSATKVGCPIIKQANEAILDQKFISNPKAFIIHAGTIDLEKEDPASVADRLIDLCNIIREKFADSGIIQSLLLPRSDYHSKKVMECNNIIKRHSSVAKNLELLDHNNLFSLGDKVLWDRKHLHKKYGVPQFASNLKATMQAEEPQTILEPTELSPYKYRGLSNKQ